ncbi:MAG TPA: hypothetical protein VFU56_07600 [Gaiellaceae bacterium]|nr:hypothetical protein [Gaiellaceae bacterium]
MTVLRLIAQYRSSRAYAIRLRLAAASPHAGLAARLNGARR